LIKISETHRLKIANMHFLRHVFMLEVQPVIEQS